MKLWTIQHYQAYEKLLKTGVLTANEEYLFCKEDLKFAYNWITQKMYNYGIAAQEGINYPIWAWYQWEGKRKRMDMRQGGYANRGEKIVQLTIDIEDKAVLLSDFDLFHYVLNYWYLPLDEADDEDFEKEYTKLGYSWADLQDFSIQTNEMKEIRKKFKKAGTVFLIWNMKITI